MDDLQSRLIFGGIVLALGVAGIWWMKRWQRRVLGDSGYRAMSLFSKTPKKSADPLEEAQVLLAYGRKQQAVQLLERALRADARRTDIQTLLRQIKSGP